MDGGRAGIGKICSSQPGKSKVLLLVLLLRHPQTKTPPTTTLPMDSHGRWILFVDICTRGSGGGVRIVVVFVSRK